jgi:hypothetical protein
VRERPDEQHAHLETSQQNHADDNLLSDKKRIHSCTSFEKARKPRAYRSRDILLFKLPGFERPLGAATEDKRQIR